MQLLVVEWPRIDVDDDGVSVADDIVEEQVAQRSAGRGSLGEGSEDKG